VSSVRNFVEASVESYRGGLFDFGLSNSLKTIRAARSRFNLLTARCSTQAALASQIELCDILLEEIRSIGCSLEKRKSSRSVMSRCSGPTKRSRGSRQLTVAQRDRPDRSKSRKSALRLREHKPEVAKRDKDAT
jgi:hypothetical protein